MADAAQLTLLEPHAPPATLVWASEGKPCPCCGDTEGGRMHMAWPSDPCACAETLCICLAEGYAICDSCGALEQVWPRDMVSR